MKTSDKLKSVLCDPEGLCCIVGSNEDCKIVNEAIKEVEKMEKFNPNPQ